MNTLARLLSSGLLSMAVAAGLVACTSTPPATPVACSTVSIAQADQPAALRALARDCASNGQTEALAAALTRLNDLPPVAGQPMGLQPAATRSQSEQVTFELDIYFHPLEAYAPVSGVEKLDLLIQRLNMTYAVESVRLVGRAERAENALPSLRIAYKRADFVRRYLLASGMHEDVPVEVREAPPAQADTDEGRARDRSVAIEVVTLRRRGDAGQ